MSRQGPIALIGRHLCTRLKLCLAILHLLHLLQLNLCRPPLYLWRNLLLNLCRSPHHLFHLLRAVCRDGGSGVDLGDLDPL